MVSPVRSSPRRTVARVFPARPFAAAVGMAAFTFLLYVVEAVDLSTNNLLDQEGAIVPRNVDHLDGVLFSPLLHANWEHLIMNTAPFLIFGFLAMAGGLRQFVMVTATIWLLGGLGVWLIAWDGSRTVGASGVIFGWLAFLLVRGFFARSGRQILLAAVLFFFWGSVLWGVFPSSPLVSWQAHLCGALAGVLAAWLVARADRRRARRSSVPTPGGFGPALPR